MFKKWRSINRFSDVYKLAQRNSIKAVTINTKIKLHGTNAGIRIARNELIPQKRSGDCLNDGHMGFTDFVSKLDFCGNHWSNDIIIYGEWAGPGIQKGDAVCNIPEKTFFVFSILDLLDGKEIYQSYTLNYIIGELFPNENNIKVIPNYFESSIVLDFSNQEECQKFIDNAVKEVNEIGICDPYIKEEYNIEGPGEGLVFRINSLNTSLNSMYFKVKTETHSVDKGKRNRVAPKKPEGVDEFISIFFTENRFNQMFNEHLNGAADRKDTGKFIKCVMSDVHKESLNEIEEADFEWKDVAKYATVKVKNWFFTKIDEI